ncbi:MAG: sigma-70 family RNA polymerase sigma factor [Chloroflexi bacterium]|nr:MAG: sigma-70 family RNA polymerase sigma factor [Chloroflexota bacterium]
MCDKSDDRPDEVLIMCAKDGDQNAFCILFLRYKGEIYVCLLKVVRSDEIAKELWQETYIKAWKHIHRLKEPTRFRAWLLTIARNLALDWLRKDRRGGHDTLEENESTSEPIAYQADSEFVVEVDCVRYTLAKMEPVLRNILILNAIGYTRAEVARQLGYTESTVTTYLAKARARFRQLYRLTDHTDETRKEQ